MAEQTKLKYAASVNSPSRRRRTSLPIGVQGLHPARQHVVQTREESGGVDYVRLVAPEKHLAHRQLLSGHRAGHSCTRRANSTTTATGVRRANGNAHSAGWAESFYDREQAINRASGTFGLKWNILETD